MRDKNVQFKTKYTQGLKQGHVKKRKTEQEITQKMFEILRLEK